MNALFVTFGLFVVRAGGLIQDPPVAGASAPVVERGEVKESEAAGGEDAKAGEAKVEDASAAVQHPTDAELSECLRLVEKGAFEEARMRGEALVAKYPRSARARLVLGLSYHKARRYEQARPHLAKAVELDPDDLPNRIFYGWCLYNLGEADESRANFEFFISHQPDYADAHFALGLLDFADGEMESAERRFEQAILLARQAKSSEDEAKALLRLSDVYVATGRLEEAKGALVQSIRLNGRLYAAWFKLSRVLERLGDEEGAAKARAMHERVRAMVRPPNERVEE